MPAGTLDEAHSKRLFAAIGILPVREVVAGSAAEAAAVSRELGASVVLKVLSHQIVHKSDVGGVKTDVRVEEVERTARAMLEEVERRSGIKVDRLLVQEHIRGGVEMLLGCRRDPQLGVAIVLGAGGVATELLDDTAQRLLPIGRADVLDMIQELRAYRLLLGFRGQAAADIDALASAVLSMAELAYHLGDRLVEAEINPLFVLPAPRGVLAADALVVLR